MRRDHAGGQQRTSDPRSEADRQELHEDLVLPRPHQLGPPRLYLPHIQQHPRGHNWGCMSLTNRSLFIAASHWEGEKVSQGDVQRKSTDWWWPVTWLSSVYQYILRVLGLLGQKSLLIVSSGKTSFRPHPPLEIHSFFTHPGTSITTMTTQLSLQPGETRITHITFYV